MNYEALGKYHAELKELKSLLDKQDALLKSVRDLSSNTGNNFTVGRHKVFDFDKMINLVNECSSIEKGIQFQIISVNDYADNCGEIRIDLK